MPSAQKTPFSDLKISVKLPDVGFVILGMMIFDCVQVPLVPLATRAKDWPDVAFMT